MDSFDEWLTNSELNITITANKRQVRVLFRLGICLVDFMSGFFFLDIYIEQQLLNFSIMIATSNLGRVIFHLSGFYTSKNVSDKDETSRSSKPLSENMRRQVQLKTDGYAYDWSRW